jgi:L-fuconolactonase
MTIDAHHHVWDLARRDQPWIDPATMSAIHRDFDIDGTGCRRDARRSAGDCGRADDRRS